jgi:P-type E1-E2 ATPase
VVAGCGVAARVDGREVQIGRLEWIGMVDTEGGRSVAVAVDGNPAARIQLTEAWRTGAAEVFEELARLGVRAEILTGDPQWDPRDLGPAVDAEGVRTGMTPDQKIERVNTLRRAGRTVVLVGDGINDAAAMSAAHLAIAMAGGAALAQATAPAVYLGDDLRFLPAAIRAARAVRRGLRLNLRFAAAYNLVGMTLAAAGWLHPVVAALLMLGSSAFVSVRALRAPTRE